MKNAKYIEVSAAPRYWEDTRINGEDDINGNIPFRDVDLWRPIIRLEDGQVMDWPIGLTANVHYKVCDEGEYWLQDGNGWRISKYAGDYVPDDFLAQDGSGFGDYIIMKINESGKIQNWKKPQIKEDIWIKI